MKTSTIILRLLAPIGVVLACLVLLWIGPTSVYETNDDVAYSLVFSGRLLSSVADSGVIYVNSVLGSLFVKFYAIAPSIPWYGLFHLVSLLFSIFFLVSLFSLRRQHDKAWLAASFSLLCILPCIFFIQFTKTAFILTLVGYVGLYVACELKSSGKIPILLLCAVSLVLVLLGLQLRKDSFFLASALFAIINFRGICRSRVAQFFFASLASLAIVFVAVDNLNYQDDWKAFRDFHFKIKPLIEKSDIDYQDNIAVFQEVGWSINDYSMLKDWAFVDDRFFNPKKVDFVIENAKRIIVPKNFYASMIEAISFPATSYILSALAIAISAVLCFKQDWHRLSLSVLVPTAIVILFVFFQGRFPTRVSVPIALSIPLAILLQSNEIRLTRNSWWLFGGLTITFIVFAFWQYRDLEKIAIVRKIQNTELKNLGTVAKQQPAPLSIITWGGVSLTRGSCLSSRRSILTESNSSGFAV